jgi:N-acetylneuraminic acid mutarotase
MRRRLAATALAISLGIAAVPVTSLAGAAGAFSDDDGNVHEPAIEKIADLGITKGCNPPANTRFCPDQAVTRGEMAAFLVRTLDLRATGSSFSDTEGNVFEVDIDKLATAEITKGCNPPANNLFCPDDHVTRGQMASFLVRALGLSVMSTSSFTDTFGQVFEADISRLAAAGITRGCNPPDNTRFCPDQPVRRDEMATFLSRAYDIATTGTTTSSTSSTGSSTTTSTSTTTTTTTITTGDSSTTSTPTTSVPAPPSGWAPMEPLSAPITDAAGAAHGGLLYLAGGKRSPTNRVDDFFAYDPDSDTWETLDDLPGAGREDAALVAAGEYLYVFGGASNDPFTGDISIAARYSPDAGVWNDDDVRDMGTVRSGMAAVLYNGDIWLIGGFAGAGDSLDTVLIYDIATDAYSFGPVLPSPRDHAGAVVVNGELLVFGGRNRNGGTTEPTSVIRLTSPDDESWSVFGDDMPRRRRSFVVGTTDNKVQVFGGESQVAETINEVDEFNPETEKWSTALPDLLTPRHGPAGATIDRSTYVVGGSLESGSTTLSDVNERFTP